jgi:hypothetical protein
LFWATKKLNPPPAKQGNSGSLPHLFNRDKIEPI